MKLKLFAKYISYLFIPPIMNLIIFIHYSITIESVPKTYYSILISFLFGLLFPLIAILQFRRKGIISNNDATIKEERRIPYIYAIGFSLAGVVLSALFELNDSLIMLWMVYLISSIIIMNINKYWKISAHTMGAAIPMGALFVSQESVLLLFSIFILTIVGVSRLYLKVHTFLQVLAGSFVGLIVSIVLIEYCL